MTFLKDFLRASGQIAVAILTIGVAAMVIFGWAIPQFGPLTPYVVTSGSMTGHVTPTSPLGMPTGTLVAVETAVSPDQIAIGDAITFTRGSGDSVATVTHQVVSLASDAVTGELGWVTRGTETGADDAETVTENALLGRVVYALPAAGYLAALPGAVRLGALFLIPIVLYAPTFLRGVRDRVRRRTDIDGA